MPILRAVDVKHSSPWSPWSFVGGKPQITLRLRAYIDSLRQASLLCSTSFISSALLRGNGNGMPLMMSREADKLINLSITICHELKTTLYLPHVLRRVFRSEKQYIADKQTGVFLCCWRWTCWDWGSWHFVFRTSCVILCEALLNLQIRNLWEVQCSTIIDSLWL